MTGLDPQGQPAMFEATEVVGDDKAQLWLEPMRVQ